MERIVAAAIFHMPGMICFLVSPARHHDIIRAMAQAGLQTPITGTQGFITSTGRFVGRREARGIAEEAGQLIECEQDGVKFIREHSELFSEDVW